RCRAGEMVLQSQTRTSRRVEQLPLNGALQAAARHARKVGRVLINSDCSAIAGCRKRRMSIARMLRRFSAVEWGRGAAANKKNPAGCGASPRFGVCQDSSGIGGI